MHLPAWVVAVAAVVVVSACGFNPPAAQTGDGGVTEPVTVGFLAESSLQDESVGAVMVPVTLSAPASEAVTVEYEFVDGSAARGSDYTGEGGTLTIDAGQMQGFVPVAIVDDGADEQNETFDVRLRAATGAVLGSDRHTVTISANLLPRASLTLAESVGEESVRPRVMVLLMPASPMPVTIDIAVTGDVSPADYGSLGTSFQIPANTTNFELELPVTDDAIDEDAENLIFTMTGSPDVIVSNARTRVHTINDNDAPPQIGFTNGSASTDEDGTVELEVKLSIESGKSIELTVSSAVGTNASSMKDYTYEATTYTIAPGATTAKVRVAIVDDALDEIDETLVTKLDSATNATIAGTSTTNLSIVDDDPMPSVAFADCDNGTTSEPTVGNVNVPRTLTLSAPSGRLVEVTLTPDNGNNNADEGADYDLPSTVTIPAEQTSATFNIRINSDTSVGEGREEIVFSITAASAATIGSPATCTHNID